MTLRFIFIALLLFMCSVAEAASPVDVYHFDTPQQQQRYRALIEEFRCPKCLNTNIAGSDAPIAQDLRKAVHRLVVLEQYTDQQVRDYLQARYGDFVLYDPPFTQRTWLIWMVPLGLGLLVLAVLFSLQRRARRHATVELNTQDQSRLKAFLEDD